LNKIIEQFLGIWGSIINYMGVLMYYNGALWVSAHSD